MALVEHLKDYTIVTSLTEGKLEIAYPRLSIRWQDGNGDRLLIEAEQVTPSVVLVDAVRKDAKDNFKDGIRMLNPTSEVSPDLNTVYFRSTDGEIVISDHMSTIINHVDQAV